jgi:hypothetical protein
LLTVTVALDTTSQALLEADRARFRASFDQQPFAFKHRLQDDPLFGWPRLMELVRSLSKTPGEVYFDAGNVRVDQRWDQVPLAEMSVEEAMERIEKSGAWILVRHAERDREYSALLDRCMQEAELLAGRPFRQEMRVAHAIVFITSPARVTPYHIDKECNFILQIKGSKTISVFNRYDRDVLSEQELERFWAYDNNAAIYKSQYQDRANVYEVQPGDAVHVPVNCPHWVKNGDNVSVTLSVNFWYRDLPRADVYRVNYFLRRLGLRPQPPGAPLRDAVKRKVLPTFEAAREVRERLRKRKNGA